MLWLSLWLLLEEIEDTRVLWEIVENGSHDDIPNEIVSLLFFLVCFRAILIRSSRAFNGLRDWYQMVSLTPQHRKAASQANSVGLAGSEREHTG